MLCRSPYVQGVQVYGCGQCIPCRINRRRIWTHRLMLEGALHEEKCFVTLTYSDEALPLGGTLVPEHLRDWLKRLRRAIEPRKVRYYGCGEYGDETKRPHYHVCLFGYPNCVYGRSIYSERKRNCCEHCDRVRETWGFGNVQVAAFEEGSARYTAGYVVKKLTKEGDALLEGRKPEFARMSLKPGIGGDVVDAVAEVLLRYECVGVDVPNALRHGSKEYPLGRYIMRRLRMKVGRDEKVPQEILDKIASELRPMFLAARASSEEPGVKAHIVKAGDGRYASMVARRKIFEKRKEKL